MKDYIVKAYAFNDTVRVYATTSTNLVNSAQKIHDLWPTSAAAFGRLLTASVTMGAMYKGEQELTIRVQGDGPIGGMVAIANAKGHVRGYVHNNHVFLQYNNGKLNVGKAVGNGFIHVTKDLKIKQPFTSSAPIQTGELAEDFAYYFTASEQIPSAVNLGVFVDDDNTILASGGFILQAMPGIQEGQIKEIEKRINALPPISDLIKDNFTPEEIIDQLSDGDYTLLEILDIAYQCNCSKKRFEKGLISLGIEELKTLYDENNPIETTCQFCNTTYHFNQKELKKLIDETKKQ
ncbi:MAG: Hsp33 family molecular chaperone HslO [Candidatus Izimaplasma sp.]|nr:Hsp33 family molecular chaperone HslO [Candidatus Izimaplasma bacterium]